MSMDVLVVDDNKFAAVALGKLLKADGYTVHLAYDGESALEIAQQLNPYAIILDLALPGMSGYEVARILKEDRGSSALLIALTGYGQKEDRFMSRKAGFDYHLTKPILSAEIERLINAPRTKIDRRIAQFNHEREG